MQKKMLSLFMLVALILIAACGNGDGSDNGSSENSNENTSEAAETTSGDVAIDGSSTVFPIMEAVSEEFQSSHEDIRVTVGVSGSGGGFEKFINGETDISNASRSIKEEEKSALEENGIDFTEIEIALDGLSVVVNEENDWVDELTIEQLKQIWSESSDVTTWSDVNEEWPDEEIEFFSPGTDSGTYDYFSEVVLGENQIKRDAALSEDDNVLVNGVTGDQNGIAYFGYAYYLENKEDLNVVPIVNGDGEAVEPSQVTIQSGEYEPLSRPMYIYVANESVQNDAVYDFLTYTLDNAGTLAEEVGYVGFTEDHYQEAQGKIDSLR
ncbi:PstS family phosphate ABC transporter substrate-binding protein [Alkalibacillus salilacus]|uniref:Phosphate-binding protein n=1 Tax=Alkalibacillus salilacus TaxID=284582 RepID=A0ABT9VEY1_9BACI|nr:PstS family phosphate ABC transporter substrate-binding protein [Alkalibacillus salilacus]MDQ0159454.1 phosphate transport system substrate-binding protein [Alkalibacillus salilacus]